MSSIKCPNCGLINFATAETCKRCKQNLEDPSYPYCSDNGPVESPKPDWSNLQTVPAVPAETVDVEDYGDGSHTFGNFLFAAYLALTAALGPIALSHLSAGTTGEIWKLVTDPKSKLYLPSFESVYYLGLVSVVVFLPASVILLVTLCVKARVFLRLVFIYLLAKFVYFILEIWLIFRLEAEVRGKHIPQLELTANQLQMLPYFSMIGVLLTFVWFRYFNSSKHARSVFE